MQTSTSVQCTTSGVRNTRRVVTHPEVTTVSATTDTWQVGRNASVSWRVRFYPRGASVARVLAVVVCLCVCVSVCLSHAGIVSKRLNVGSRKQRQVIDQGP